MNKLNMETTTITQGAHHIGLTVPDIKQTSNFFISELNFKQVGKKPDYPAIFVSDGKIMLTLWQTTDPKTALAFDRKNNIGLHHLALRVKNSETLDKLYQRLLNTDNVKIEFSPEQLGNSSSRHMMSIVTE